MAATVTVSSTTTTTRVSSDIHFDPTYIRTVPGILKIAQIVISLVGFICSQASPHLRHLSVAGWYAFVAMTAFWVTLFLLIFYLFHIIEKLHWIPWLLAEFVYCAVWTAFFFIAGVVSATYAPHDEAFGAAAFFAFVAMVLYGYDAFEKYKLWRSGAIAQGERDVTSSGGPQQPKATSPSYPTY